MVRRALRPGVNRSDLILADLVGNRAFVVAQNDPPDAAAVVAAIRSDETPMHDARRLLTEPKAAQDLLVSALEEVLDVLADGAGHAAVYRLLVEPDRRVATATGFTLLGSFITAEGVALVVSLAATVTRDVNGQPIVTAVSVDDYVGGDLEGRLVEDVVALASATGFIPERPMARAALIVGSGFGAHLEEVRATAAVAGVAVEVFHHVDPEDAVSMRAIRRRIADSCSGLVTWTGKRDKWAMRLAKGAENLGKLRFAIHGDDETAAPQMRTIANQLVTAEKALRAGTAATAASRTLTLCLKKTGNRGTGDVLEQAQPCSHKEKPKARPSAEAKWKGAQDVLGLPQGAVLRKLLVCGRTDCNVAWATYRLPGTQPEAS